MPHGAPIGTRQNRRRNKKSIEDGQAQSDSFPGPIAARGDRGRHDQQRPSHGDRRTNTEEAQPRAHPDELRDQRQEISQDQIAHGEESPKFAEAIEDQFGVSAVRDGAQSHRHFLHHESHDKRKHHKRYEESNSEARTIRRVRKHAGRIVLAQKHQHARSHQQPQQPDIPQGLRAAPLGTRLRHLPSVPRAVHVLGERDALDGNSSLVAERIGAVHVLVGQKTNQFRRRGRGDGGLRGRMCRRPASAGPAFFKLIHS